MLYDDVLVKINNKSMFGRICASTYGYKNEYERAWVSVSPFLVEKYYQLFDEAEFKYCGPTDEEFGKLLPKCDVYFRITDKEVALTVTDQTNKVILSRVVAKGDKYV